MTVPRYMITQGKNMTAFYSMSISEQRQVQTSAVPMVIL